MEPHLLLAAHPLLMLVAAVAAEAKITVLAIARVALAAAAMVVAIRQITLALLVVQTQGAVEAGQLAAAATLVAGQAQAAQAVQVSSSLNTSPNLITKSSNHQAHGLHLVALLRSST
jgi:predicted phosphoribosyltransferase